MDVSNDDIVAPSNMAAKAGHASLIVNQRALSILLRNNASAMQICAYLTLSSFTKRGSHKYESTAGCNAVMNRLGIGSRKAKELIASLGEMQYGGNKLLEARVDGYDPEALRSALGGEAVDSYIEQMREKHSSIKWELTHGEMKELWLHKDIVGVGRSHKKPLKTLWRLCGHFPTQLYLALFITLLRGTDLITTNVLSYTYKFEEVLKKNGMVLYKTEHLGPLHVHPALIGLFNGPTTELNAPSVDHKRVKTALDILEHHNFLFRTVQVNYVPEDKVCWYDLDCKTRVKSNDFDTLWGNDMRELGARLGCTLKRQDNRLYGEYFFVAPEGIGVDVNMGYRLRYSAQNPNVYRVSKALKERQEVNDEVTRWIGRLLLSP